MLFRISKKRTSMMLALEGKIRVTVFSEMLFRTSRQRGSNTCYTRQRVPCYLRNAVQDKQAKRNKYDTCFGGRRRARSELLSSQKCCSGQAGKERTSMILVLEGGGGQDQSRCLLRNAVQDKQAKREQVGTCSTGKEKER